MKCIHMGFKAIHWWTLKIKKQLKKWIKKLRYSNKIMKNLKIMILGLNKINFQKLNKKICFSKNFFINSINLRLGLKFNKL